MALLTLDPALNAVDRIRINVGDIDVPAILDDALYQYFLDTNNDNENKATLQSLEAIVAKLAKNMHEKSDLEESRASEQYEHYKERLDELKRDPDFNGGFIPYAGGISKSDIKANENNSDANLNTITKNSIWD